MPKGLIDEGETPEATAIRELEEETGFKAENVIECSPLLVSDPGPYRVSELPDTLKELEDDLYRKRFFLASTDFRLTLCSVSELGRGIPGRSRDGVRGR